MGILFCGKIFVYFNYQLSLKIAFNEETWFFLNLNKIKLKLNLYFFVDMP